MRTIIMFVLTAALPLSAHSLTLTGRGVPGQTANAHLSNQLDLLRAEINGLIERLTPPQCDQDEFQSWNGVSWECKSRWGLSCVAPTGAIFPHGRVATTEWYFLGSCGGVLHPLVQCWNGTLHVVLGPPDCSKGGL